MSTQPQVEIDYVALRATILDDMLKAERWSRRKVATALAVSPPYINARMNGEIDLSFSDIEAIAGLLRMGPVDLYALLHDATKKAPTPEGEGLLLPEMDSNHQPAGIKPIGIKPLTDDELDALPEHDVAPLVTLADRRAAA